VLILAFDTSGQAGSVALLDGAHVLSERLLDEQRRSAQSLAPALADVLTATGVRPADVRLVATTVGPGSFTGLRVGVTAAKTFAYAVGAEVLGLSTLEVIAHQCSPLAPRAEMSVTDSALPTRVRTPDIHAVLDAHRKELFLGRFQVASSPAVGDELPHLTRLEADRLIAADIWLATLPPETLVTGKGLEKVLDRLPAGVTVAPQQLWEPQAATIGQLAWRDYQAGRRDNLWKLSPVYLRPSYAEEKKKTHP
jgi:tRNA threonylcarbamoyladenosine biosynthesis protein TsaB